MVKPGSFIPQRRSNGADFRAYRRAVFEKKVGGAVAQVEHLKGYKKCFEADEHGIPVMSSREFERFMNLTSPKHVEQVQKFHERTLEKRYAESKGPTDSYSHVITAMLMLRPDVSALAFQHAKGMFESIAREGYDVSPFLSLNDFSFISSIYKNDLPRILGGGKMAILRSAMQNEFAPEEDLLTSGLPFSQIHTDKVAGIIRSFLLERINDLTAEGKTDEVPEIDRILAQIKVRTGKGLEFEFVPKDLSLMTVGDEMGDCMASNPRNEVLKEYHYLTAGNMFPHAPLWLASPNVQTFLAYHDGSPIMKFRFFIGKFWDRWVLVFDEFTIRPQARGIGDVTFTSSNGERESVYDGGIKFMAEIAKKMGGIPLVTDDQQENGRPRWFHDKNKPLQHELLSTQEIDWEATNEPLKSFIFTNAPDDPIYSWFQRQVVQAWSCLDTLTGNWMVRLDGGSFTGGKAEDGGWHNHGYF